MSAGQTKRGSFRLDKDYSTIPNRLYDEWLPRLNSANFRGHGDVLGVIARQTIGWGQESAAIGTPRLAALTGYSKQRVCEILDELESMGAIVRQRPGNGKTTRLGIVLGWEADDAALDRGFKTREERLEKKFKHSEKASRKAVEEQFNLSTHTDRLENEPVNSFEQVTCQLSATGDLSTHTDRFETDENTETPVNTRAPGEDDSRLKKRKERERKNTENQSISLLDEGESGVEPTDRPTLRGEDSSSSKDWRAAKDWRDLDALVEAKLGLEASNEARELRERIEEMVGGSSVLPRRKLDALAGMVGSSGAAALLEAARRLAGQRRVRHHWPYLLKTLPSAAEELGDEVDAPDPRPARQGAAQSDASAGDDHGLRTNLEAALGRSLPRMFSAARLRRDDQGRKTVVARDGAHRRDIETAWGHELDDGGWRLACGDEGSGEKKGEVA